MIPIYGIREIIVADTGRGSEWGGRSRRIFTYTNNYHQITSHIPFSIARGERLQVNCPFRFDSHLVNDIAGREPYHLAIFRPTLDKSTGFGIVHHSGIWQWICSRKSGAIDLTTILSSSFTDQIIATTTRRRHEIVDCPTERDGLKRRLASPANTHLVIGSGCCV